MSLFLDDQKAPGDTRHWVWHPASQIQNQLVRAKYICMHNLHTMSGSFFCNDDYTVLAATSVIVSVYKNGSLVCDHY